MSQLIADHLFGFEALGDQVDAFSNLDASGSDSEEGQSPTSAKTVRVLDLFAGAGGLSSGFRAASSRYQTVRAIEIDPAAAATFAANFGNVVHNEDINEWLAHEATPHVDLVIGGPPCQGFSTIGRRDPADLRNTLWRPYVETVRRSAPKAFVMENVPAFVKSGEYHGFLEEFAEGELRDFEIQARVLNAADYGTPQVRKRVIVIGVHRDLEHPGHPAAVVTSPSTVREAFAGIQPFAGELALPARRTAFEETLLPGPFQSCELHVGRNWTPLAQDRFRAIPYGGSRLDLPDDLSMDCWRKSPRSAGDVMGRLEWDKPSVTIRTEFFRPEKGRFTHPTQHRTITHWEAARLQGFPDAHLWVGSLPQIARQIGNAVPVPLASAIARHLDQAL